MDVVPADTCTDAPDQKKRTVLYILRFFIGWMRACMLAKRTVLSSGFLLGGCARACMLASAVDREVEPYVERGSIEMQGV